MRRAVVLLLLTLPLGACGGSSRVATPDPLAQAASKTTNAAGAHFQMTGRVEVQGQALSFSGPGEIADHGKKVHMRLSMPLSVLGVNGGGSGNATLDAVAAGDSFYLRGGPLVQFAKGKWVRIKSNNPSFHLGQNDPSKMLEYLRATSKVEERGRETVRGVETTHYTARVQVDKLGKQTSLQGAKEIPLDVWIDADGLVRRIKVDSHQEGTSFAVTMDMFDFGDVSVDVPPASDTVDLSTMLGGG